jgi:alpha-glucosidase
MAWLPVGADAIAYTRGDRFACVVNMSASPIDLPEFRTCLLASGPIHPAAENRRQNGQHDGVRLPPDTAVWLRLP